MKNALRVGILAILSFFCSHSSYAQKIGDYRSSALLGTVDLANPLNWEKYTTVLGSNTWVLLSALGVAPINDFREGQTITIRSGDTWSNSTAVTIPAGVTVLHQGSNGTFSTINKITMNGAYNHATSASPVAVSNGMNLNNSSSVWFTYSGSQVIPGRTDYEDLIITGGGTKTLSGACSVSGDVTLTNTTLDLGSSDLSVTGTVSGSSSGYIKTSSTGKLVLKDIGAGARTFPVGRSTYNPVTISNGGSMDYSVLVTDGVGNVVAPYNTTKAIQRSWYITPAGSPSGATITFQYNDGDASQKGSSYATSEDVVIWNYHNNFWVMASGGQTPTGSAGGIRTVTLTNQSLFSPFAVANISGPLPVHFSGLSAVRSGQETKIHFTNETESEIIAYDIERSTDARRFSTAGTIAARKNDGGISSYQFVDAAPVAVRSWYRVVGRERSGNRIYSKALLVADQAQAGLTVVAAAGSGLVTLDAGACAAGAYDIRIYTVSGQLVSAETVQHAGGRLQHATKAPERAGVYLLQVSGARSVVARFVVR